MSDVVDAMARGICRDRCAFMGEPACWQLDDADGGPYPFPAEGCGDVNCVDMARAAIRAVTEAGGLVVGKMPEEYSLGRTPEGYAVAMGRNRALEEVRAAAVEVE